MFSISLRMANSGSSSNTSTMRATCSRSVLTERDDGLITLCLLGMEMEMRTEMLLTCPKVMHSLLS
jgi:hypothetical protein